MPTYKNVGGSAWRRSSNNELVLPGQTFVATQIEHERISRRSYMKRRLALVPDKELPPPPQEKKPVAEEVTSKTAPPEKETAVVPSLKWPLRMTPTQYVRLHPKGQYAELAKLILEDDE